MINRINIRIFMLWSTCADLKNCFVNVTRKDFHMVRAQHMLLVWYIHINWMPNNVVVLMLHLIFEIKYLKFKKKKIWILENTDDTNPTHGPLTRYVKLRILHALGMPGTLSPPPTSTETASDPGIYHDTCVTHVSWYMPGSLTGGGGENVPGIPGACVTRNITYLSRGPCPGCCLWFMGCGRSQDKCCK